MRWDAMDQRASELLLALCRRGVSATSASLAASFLAKEPLRARLLEVALRHGLVGLVLARVEESGDLGALPEEVRVPVQRELKRLRMRAALMQIERDLVLATLGEANVHPVVLKGAGLATTVFAAPVERDFGDIDVLLPTAEFDAAVAALEGRGYQNPMSAAATNGYRAHHFHIRMQRPGATIVELHWGLVSREELFRLDAPIFLERSVDAGAAAVRTSGSTGAQVQMRVPCPEHALLHTVLECARGAFSRVKWLVDIDRIVAGAPVLDWEYVVAGAREASLLPTLWLSLELSNRLLGTQIPAAVLTHARPSWVARVHLTLLHPAEFMMRQRTVDRASSADLLRLWLLANRSRAAWLARLVTPAADDPLQWMWDDLAERPSAPPTWRQRAARAGKLIADQGATYAAGVRDLLTREGRARLRMW